MKPSNGIKKICKGFFDSMKKTRGAKVIINTFSYFLYILIDIVCAFIVPRLILTSYGSSSNGIVASITQFLSYTEFLFIGVSGATRAALYGPLSKGDKESVSKIVRATSLFMQKVAYVFLGFLVLLAVVYPFFVIDEYDYSFSFTLTLILGASSFFQYFFATTSRILLGADQKTYVITIISIITLLLQTILSIVMIKLGANLHQMKIGVAIIQILNPLVTFFYVKKKYKLNYSADPDKTALKNRWNASAISIANFINKNTDIVVITLFAGTLEVSVYTIYYLVVNGVSKVGTALSSGIEAAFGNMVAIGNEDVLKKNFSCFETIIFSISNIIYSSCIVLIVPFILIYTSGVTDVSYNRIAFGLLATLAGFFATVRNPYQSICQAAGKYKETRDGAILEAFVNITLSITFVLKFGLVGVTIGTLAAMIIRTIQYAYYAYNHLVKIDIKNFYKRLFVSLFIIAITYILYALLPMPAIDNYWKWALLALCVVLFTTLLTLLLDLLFWKKDLKNIAVSIKNILKKDRVSQ